MEELTLAIGDIIVGIDIGNSKVSTFVGEVNNFNQIETICSTSAKCQAFQKGQIVDEDELSMAIGRTMSEVEDIAGIHVNSAYTTIPGKYITIVQNSIVKDAKDKLAGISVKDVASAIIQVRNIEIPEDKVLIDIVPDKFILDDGKAVDDPVGKFSNNFTLTAQIILAEGALYLARTKKSNKVVVAIGNAMSEVAESGNLPVPNHLRDAHYSGSKELGRGIGYKYPHDYKDSKVDQQYLPDEIKDKKFS